MSEFLEKRQGGAKMPRLPHLCHALRCTTPVSPAMFMCKTHWYQVPRKDRQLLVKLYVPGQEFRKDPSEAYVQTAIRIRNELADREGLWENQAGADDDHE